MDILNHIDNTYESYQSIISFYQANKDKGFDSIQLELHNFFAANMSAALGAVLDLFTESLNDINFDYISPQIEQILLKNDFLTYYGKSRAIDVNHTTIKFQKLKPTDCKFFKTYVIEGLVDRDELPKMSAVVKEKIVEAIYEVFVNAQIHSETNFIYTCGQFYPNKNKIEFTIVDTGIGFKNRINKRFNSNLSATKAIEWAVEDKKTTKEGVSGGIGLAVLKEFISMNKGKMQIVSDTGFYQYDKSGVVAKQFTGLFPGTIVNLQFCTNDRNNYVLKRKIDINDIF
ncbi:MAG: ATP-binding protein [Prevotellaceae bacterium]|jgi:anti-sigma regulatory factor (Ser/Thr protein kinase)|nr:ATP-binding protein [Prevotellaceae bacterium]